MRVRWKVFIICLLVVVLIEAFIIYMHEKEPFVLPAYSYFDLAEEYKQDNYIKAKGTWLSDMKLASPLQTTVLECLRDRGICVETTAQLFGGLLVVENYYYPIENWTPEEVTFKDIDPSIACTYRLHIDRKNKAITCTRFTKQPNPLKGQVQDEPIFMHLGDPYGN